MSPLARQDTDCRRQAPIISTVHELIVRTGMERGKAFDLADQIVRTVEPTIAAGILTVVHNGLLSVIAEMIHYHNGGPLRPRQSEILREFVERLELDQRAFGDALNAAQAENQAARR